MLNNSNNNDINNNNNTNNDRNDNNRKFYPTGVIDNMRWKRERKKMLSFFPLVLSMMAV
jgi:hypothetical protein